MDGCVLRVGTVTAVDEKRYAARVRFDDLRDRDGNPMISDWLQVVQRPGTGLNITEDGGHSHSITVSVGSASADTAEDHAHAGSVTDTWTPKVNDQVMALYEGVANGRGYIVGEVIPWR